MSKQIMETYFQSRIPLSVSNRKKFVKPFPRHPLAAISLNQRFCDSLANTKQNVSKQPCSICATTKKPPATPYPKHPPLDDYKGRYTKLLEKFEILNGKLNSVKSELEGCKRKNEILENKLANAVAEVKSLRQDLKRMKATNRTDELTIGVLERKIAELRIQTDASDEMSMTRFGRSVRPPDKYQSSS